MRYGLPGHMWNGFRKSGAAIASAHASNAIRWKPERIGLKSFHRFEHPAQEVAIECMANQAHQREDIAVAK